MRTAYPRDKKAQIAKILLWLALLCLLIPLFFAIVNYVTLTVSSAFLWLLIISCWLILVGSGIVFLLIFLHSGYRVKGHASFVVLSELVLFGHLIGMFLSLDLPFVWLRCSAIALPALPLLWVICSLIKVPVWPLRILNAIPGILFALSLFLDGYLGIFHAIQVAHLLYCAACVLIIPSIVRTTQKNLN